MTKDEAMTMLVGLIDNIKLTAKEREVLKQALEVIGDKK